MISWDDLVDEDIIKKIAESYVRERGGCAEEIKTPSDLIPPVKEKYFEIYDITKYSYPQEQYFIFDSNHDVLDYAIVSGYPKMKMTSGLVKVCMDCGFACFNCRYYDPEKRLISEWFENPITESDTMVVYLNYKEGVQLIIRDIFDKSKYYKSFFRDFSLAPYVDFPVTDAVFINGGKQLRITYIADRDKNEVTETLELYPAETEGGT